MDTMYSKKLHDFKEDKTFIEIYDKDQGVPMGLFGKGIIHYLKSLDDEGNWDIQLVSEEGTYHFKFDENHIVILRVNG